MAERQQYTVNVGSGWIFSSSVLKKQPVATGKVGAVDFAEQPAAIIPGLGACGKGTDAGRDAGAPRRNDRMQPVGPCSFRSRNLLLRPRLRLDQG